GGGVVVLWRGKAGGEGGRGREYGEEGRGRHLRGDAIRLADTGQRDRQAAHRGDRLERRPRLIAPVDEVLPAGGLDGELRRAFDQQRQSGRIAERQRPQ